MQTKITLPRSALETYVFAGQDPCRSNLNRIHIERRENQKGYEIVTTSGHYLMHLSTSVLGGDDIWSDDIPSIALDCEEVSGFLKYVKKGKEFCVTQDGPDDAPIISSMGKSIKAQTETGTFPPWRQVVPTERPDKFEPSRFNIEYLSMLARYLKTVGIDSKTGVDFYGVDSMSPTVLVPAKLPTNCDVVEFVLMPIRRT